MKTSSVLIEGVMLNMGEYEHKQN